MASSLLGLDVGEKRIGVALADDAVTIAIPYVTIDVNGAEIKEIAELIVRENVQKLIIGYPRNQSGEATAQTAFVEEFSQRLKDLVPEIIFQDESLTSVIAEERLKASGKPYQKGDIDAQAAAIILQDYLERHS